MKKLVNIGLARQWDQHVAASTSLRMQDDEAEQEFWRQFIPKKHYEPELSARQVLAWLQPMLKQYGVESALEFGPGWGSYTMDLARRCREVTCVDLSRDVLEFVLRTGKELGLNNIIPCHSKWENFEPMQKYDLVFGWNCFYRQASLTDCMARIDRAAGKLCVVGMNSGLAPLWVRELEAAGAQVNYEWKDYIYFVGALYEMGICANVQVLPFEKEYTYPDEEAMIAGEQKRCGAEEVDRETVRRILKKHFTPQPDGSWKASAPYHSGIVWWQPTGNQ